MRKDQANETAILKEKTYRKEEMFLSPYAKKARETLGRARAEEACPMRTDFQRDRDRIIYCKAFRRLKNKTQVFFSPFGDHYRTRLTHTLDVSQISRSIARALNRSFVRMSLGGPGARFGAHAVRAQRRTDPEQTVSQRLFS